jgi:hypothetical protein
MASYGQQRFASTKQELFVDSWVMLVVVEAELA